MRRLMTAVLLMGGLSFSNATVSVKEIRTASNNVLVVFLKGTMRSAAEVDVASTEWKINGNAPAKINLYAMESDKCDYHVYLETSTLKQDSSYLIHTPYGDTTITFDDHQTFCESIKTNQSAYSTLSKSNAAYFQIWLGDGGGKTLTGTFPDYEVFEQYTKKTVFSGTVAALKEEVSAGGYVYKIDLSGVPEGGPYKIAVKGYGCSYPFGVGGDFSKRLAYIIFRGQYYQRCGCPLPADYGLNVREKPCHVTIYDVDGPIGEANIDVTGTPPTFECYGGYHDAGDADRRAYHMANPITNLMIYEAFPDLFFDGQYNIPDKFDSSYNILGKGNGIPDIIDEAIWGTRIWEYLQNDDGSIHWGTETRGYPSPFDAPMDLDTKKYGTVIIDDRPAAVGAGLFLHLARLVKPYDTAYANKLIARSEKSFNYIKDRMAESEKLYYYVQKYLLDGDAAAHEQIKNLKNITDGYKSNLFEVNGYRFNDTRFDNPAYFFSYMVEKNRPTDSSVVNYFKTSLKGAADANLTARDEYAYPVGNNPNSGGWGHNVYQPYYACAPVLYWKFTKEQKYIDGACDLMNYLLGANPLGISYVTGLGMHQVHNPHDRESAYTAAQGWGPKPGIAVFGPGIITGGPAANTFPALSTLPSQRKFADYRETYSMTEFTIFQTMTHYALYTVLSNGGTWDESNDPFAKQQVGVTGKVRSQRTVQPKVKASLNGNIVQFTVSVASTDRIHGALYSVNGKKVMNIDLGRVDKGTHTLTVQLPASIKQRLANGVLISKLMVDNRICVNSLINQ